MNFFEQDDYKEALKIHMRNTQKHNRGAYKNLAEYLGVHATLISQILSGSKDFTEEQIFSVCEFLGVPKLESQYLWVLVQIERAGSVKLKDHYRELKNQLRTQALQVSNRVEKNRTLSETEKATFYSSWLFSAIQVATSLETEVNFDFICKKFNLPPAKARELLDFLIQIQLIVENEGRLSPGSASTHIEKKSPFAIKHHTNWRLKAIQALENLSDEELIYSANFSISKNDFRAFREELVLLIQKFLLVVKQSPAEEIAQFNLDFFWIK